MEVFSGTGTVVRLPALMFRLMWPLVQWFVYGGMRSTIDWSLRVPTPPVLSKRLRCLLPPDLDVALLLRVVGVAVAAAAAVVVVVAVTGRWPWLATREWWCRRASERLCCVVGCQPDSLMAD